MVPTFSTLPPDPLQLPEHHITSTMAGTKKRSADGEGSQLKRQRQAKEQGPALATLRAAMEDQVR